MYTLVRRFIKTGVLFLGVGLGLGLFMLARRELLGQAANPWLATAHAHAVFVGFVLFLILGVALWLFPRPEKTDTRYRPGRIEASYWLLTAGTAMRVLAEASRALLITDAQRWAVLAGGAAQVLGVAVYFWSMWGRIRPVGSHLREARGEKF